MTPVKSEACAGFVRIGEGEKKITITDRTVTIRTTMRERYGRADRFVIRALNASRKAFAFYGSTPAQMLHYILDHLERISTLRPPFITQEQKDAATEDTWEIYRELSQLDQRERDRGVERNDKPKERATGDALVTHLVGSMYNNDGASHAGPGYDSDEGEQGQQRMSEPTDDRYGMRDPALELSRYRINPRVIHLTAREDARFVLHGQHHIMEKLRAIERKLWPREARRMAREASTLMPTQ